MRFAEPWVLLLLALPLGYGWHRWRRRERAPAEHITFSSLAFLSDAPRTLRSRWRAMLPALRVLALALLVVALARPQLPSRVADIRIRSRNLMLVLDISSSMKSGDFKPGNRLTVARRVLGEFAARREGDLLGIVIFAGRAFLQAPLTPDVELVRRLLDRVDIGMLPDGTAIGTALAMSLNQLKDLPSKASAIMLVTDGANNTGKPSPFVAAEAARALGVRIHTIGVSTADTSGQDKRFIWRWGRQADRLTSSDEAVLRRIAERSGGRYYRATDPETLEQVMHEIDPLERVDAKIGETRDYRELFPWLVAPALGLLGAELLLGLTWLRTVP